MSINKLKSLFAKITKHKEQHPIDPSTFPVDGIFFVNLDRAKGRRAFIEAQLEPYKQSVPVVRIRSVDGHNVSPNVSTELSKTSKPILVEIDGLSVLASYNQKMTEYGCTLSHLKAISAAYTAGYERALVVEDDAYLDVACFWEPNILAKLLDSAPEDLGLLQLYWGASSTCFCEYKDPVAIRKIDRDNPCWGTIAYIVTRKGMQDILTFANFLDEDGTFHPETGTPARPIYVANKKANSPTYGVADQFLFYHTGTYNTSKPMVAFNSCDFGTLIHSENGKPSNSECSRAITIIQKHAPF